MKPIVTFTAKYSYIAKVKKGNKVYESKFKAFSSTLADAKEELESWFYATRQKAQVINIVKA